ncbi:cation diffusion facilitator family transporter [Streptomyces cellulosae]
MDGKQHAHHDHDRQERPTRTRRLRRWRHRLAHLLTPHSHEAGDKVDAAMETSREGMRTLWISLVVLGVTTVVQAVIVALSGSVALLGDTVHNAADALTAVPLGLAFLLGRRPANRRYTYGYGRAEDLAGVLIVATIAASAVLAAWTAVDRLLNPRDVTHLWAVSGAALAGFVGNEWVARFRIRTGRRIGSAALVADGRLTVVEAHRIAVAAEHALIHAVPRLTAATVHTDHTPVEDDPHAVLHHHTSAGRRTARTPAPSTSD